jgi:hypothetical protein
MSKCVCVRVHARVCVFKGGRSVVSGERHAPAALFAGKDPVVSIDTMCVGSTAGPDVADKRNILYSKAGSSSP